MKAGKVLLQPITEDELRAAQAAACAALDALVGPPPIEPPPEAVSVESYAAHRRVSRIAASRLLVDGVQAGILQRTLKAGRYFYWPVDKPAAEKRKR